MDDPSRLPVDVSASERRPNPCRGGCANHDSNAIHGEEVIATESFTTWLASNLEQAIQACLNTQLRRVPGSVMRVRGLRIVREIITRSLCLDFIRYLLLSLYSLCFAEIVNAIRLHKLRFLDSVNGHVCQPLCHMMQCGQTLPIAFIKAHGRSA